MPNDETTNQELIANLKKLGEIKAPLPPRCRRYKRKERELVLSGVESLGFLETSRLTGVREYTIQTWQRRAKVQGVDVDKTQGHHEGYHPHWKKVLELWKTRPGMGPTQICNQLNRDKIRISVQTVRTIMEENGYSPPIAAVKEERLRRYEAVRPRELIHMDFKHFYIHKQKAFLLLLQDDYSRFLCGHRLTDSENIDAVIATFEDCVNLYGKMQTIMTDAGSAFYSWNGINRFQKLIAEEYGVDHIKASSPRSNGKVESVNKQIEKELLKVQEFSSLDDAAFGIEEWVRFYNFERTHMGLPKGMVPADRFLAGWGQGQAPRPQVEIAPPAAPVAAASPEVSPPATVWEEILKVALTKIK